MTSTVDAYAAGRYAEAEQDAAKLEADHEPGDNDRLIYLLEEGQILTVTGKAQKGREVLAEAHELTAPFLDEESDTSVTEETAATLLNPAVTTYRGTSYDRIMLNVLQAMNAMQLGDQDAVRVDLNRAQAWQEDAKANNARRIEAAQEKLEEEGEKEGYDVASALKSSELDVALQNQNASLKDLRGYAGYVNPYAQHLAGVYRLSLGRAAEANRARDYFRQAAGVLSGNAKKAVLEDVTRASRAAAGRRLAPSTYVYFFNGLAPAREQFKLRIPIPFRAGGNLKVIYVAAAFPTLKLRDGEVTGLTVEGARGYSVELADMDAIVNQVFQDELPLVITQAILSAAIKGAAQYGLAEGLGGWGNLAGAVLTELTTSADLRTWETLPKQIQYVRVDTPADGKLVIKGGGRALATVEVEPGSNNVVWITTPAPTASPATAKASL